MKNDKKTLENYVNFIQAMPEHARQVANFDAKQHKTPMMLKEWKSLLALEETERIVYLAVYGRKDKVCGYVITHATSESSVAIERLLVDPELRRIKIGTRLLLRCKGDLPSNYKRIHYVVPEVDLDTQLFLRAVGFKAQLPIKVGAFPGYTPSEDGIKFTYRIARDSKADSDEI
jgi:hypothetical protein